MVVVGGSGRSGSRILAQLSATGHDARGASRSSGVDTVTGAGVAQAVAGADVLVDASDPRGDALEFFTRSTATLLEHGRRAGVRHHVVLSVVGADRMPDAPYMRAKVAQEELVRRSGIPFTIVRATQFHEFLPDLVDVFSAGDVVRVPQARMQPVAVEDVAELVAGVATGAPLNETMELGGPEPMSFAEAIARVTSRRVVMDQAVKYFGAALQDDTLLPARHARLGKTRL